MRTNTRSRWRTFAGLTLTTVALCFSQSGAVQAQTQEPAKPVSEVEQLKQRLQQLEQTVSDLKAQITSLEEKKAKNPAPAAVVDATYTEPATPAPEPPPA